MPREVDECSFICDCGHRSDFFENTIRDLKRMSFRREERLGDAASKNSHTIVFKGGRMVRIICPNKGRAAGRKATKPGRTAGTAAGMRPAKAAAKPAAKSKTGTKPTAKLTVAELDKLVEEATVDAHDEEEAVSGFFCVMDQDLKFPFQTTVLGVPVSVDTIEQTENNDIVAVCQAGKHRQRIRLADLPLPVPEPAGAKWIAAYKHWIHEGGGVGDEEE